VSVEFVRAVVAARRQAKPTVRLIFRRPKRRNGIGRTVSLLLAMILVTALGAPQAAYADPLNSNAEPGAELPLPWIGLGLPSEITLTGANINQDYTVPVPSGFRVTRLRGLIHSPVDFGAGFVEIVDGTGRFLATVDLPAVTPSQAVVPFDVDVSAATVTDARVVLSLTVREPGRPAQERCGLGERVVMSDLVAAFVGAEPAPTTIASFFPSVLQRLVIYAPVDADDAERQAVLTLASAVARMYRPQSVAITVVDQPRGAAPPPAPQLTRAIVVERGDAGLGIVNADRANVFLKVTGRGDQLADQASLVVNELQSLAQVPTARVDKAGSATASGLQPDEMTFGQLGLAGETAVLRTAKLAVGVDRAALGAHVDGVKVHLLATHTPVSAMDSATLMVSVNGQAVHASPLNDSGRVDAVFEVPGEFLRQRVGLEFDLTFSPRQLCSPTIAPLAFQLDPRSTLTVRRGGAPLGGFDAVPSELSPEFLVAFDGSNPNQLDYATRVVANLARQSGSDLKPRVVDVKAAADGSTGALIVANAATVKQTSMRPPIGGEGSDVQVDLRDELRADINRGLASIQVFADEPRQRTVVLVTTSGAWSLVEPLFGYLDQLPGAWADVDGDVLAAGTDGTVTSLSIGPGDTAQAAAPEDGTDRSVWLAVGAGCLVLAVLAVGGALWWRRRRTAAAGGAAQHETH
jgi:hypothetical protein